MAMWEMSNSGRESSRCRGPKQGAAVGICKDQPEARLLGHTGKGRKPEDMGAGTRKAPWAIGESRFYFRS